MSTPNVREISSVTEWQELLTQNKHIVVDFWAPWCGPCRHLAPIFQQIADDQTFSSVVFCKIDIDVCTQVASEQGVVSIPTLMVFENGKEKARQIGGLDFPTLNAWVKQHVS